MGPITVRIMNANDVDSVAEIETRDIGTRRRDFWGLKVESMHARSPVPALVAESDGHVVGFVMGAASEWEYGVPQTIGWIDAIGVHPEYKGRGVARLLCEELIAYMRKVGVTKVYTLVSWRDHEMGGFFDKLGFKPGDMLNLEKDI